jgi:F-box protein 9
MKVVHLFAEGTWICSTQATLQGLSVGTWHIAAASVDDDEEARHDALVYIDNLKAQEPPEPCRRELKYHFQMTLSLRSRPLGRWNKLDFLRYAVGSLYS